MMKKVICLVLSVAMVLSMGVVSSSAASKRDCSYEEAVATQLKSLNLFKGVSETNFDLGRAPSRAEALVIMERLLGKESEILAGTYSHPFTDVPEWANNYVGYAYENGLTNGVSATKFGTGTASSDMFLTFVLRSMGYSDSEGDFTWDNPDALAKELGVLDDSIVVGSGFLRADCGSICFNALGSKLKSDTKTLGDKLIAEKVFTKAAYEAASYEVKIARRMSYQEDVVAVGGIDDQAEAIKAFDIERYNAWIHGDAGQAEALNAYKEGNFEFVKDLPEEFEWYCDLGGAKFLHLAHAYYNYFGTLANGGGYSMAKSDGKWYFWTRGQESSYTGSQIGEMNAASWRKACEIAEEIESKSSKKMTEYEMAVAAMNYVNELQKHAKPLEDKGGLGGMISNNSYTLLVDNKKGNCTDAALLTIMKAQGIDCYGIMNTQYGQHRTNTLARLDGKLYLCNAEEAKIYGLDELPNYYNLNTCYGNIVQVAKLMNFSLDKESLGVEREALGRMGGAMVSDGELELLIQYLSTDDEDTDVYKVWLKKKDQGRADKTYRIVYGVGAMIVVAEAVTLGELKVGVEVPITKEVRDSLIWYDMTQIAAYANKESHVVNEITEKLTPYYTPEKYRTGDSIAYGEDNFLIHWEYIGQEGLDELFKITLSPNNTLIPAEGKKVRMFVRGEKYGNNNGKPFEFISFEALQNGYTLRLDQYTRELLNVRDKAGAVCGFSATVW